MTSYTYERIQSLDITACRGRFQERKGIETCALFAAGTCESLLSVGGCETRENHCSGGAQHIPQGADRHEVSPQEWGAAHTALLRVLQLFATYCVVCTPTLQRTTHVSHELP